MIEFWALHPELPAIVSESINANVSEHASTRRTKLLPRIRIETLRFSSRNRSYNASLAIGKSFRFCLLFEFHMDFVAAILVGALVV